MDIRKVKKLIELLEESGIAEIEIKEGEEAVRISRMPTGTAAFHGMPTYAMPIARMAELFTTIPERIVSSMRERPELIGGRDADDTDLMHALPGWIAKRGAEGLLTALPPDGVGWAFKVEDGSTRALRPALGQVLGIDAFRTVEVRNSLGEAVGSIR